MQNVYYLLVSKKLKTLVQYPRMILVLKITFSSFCIWCRIVFEQKFNCFRTFSIRFWTKCIAVFRFSLLRPTLSWLFGFPLFPWSWSRTWSWPFTARFRTTMATATMEPSTSWPTTRATTRGWSIGHRLTHLSPTCRSKLQSKSRRIVSLTR